MHDWLLHEGRASRVIGSRGWRSGSIAGFRDATASSWVAGGGNARRWRKPVMRSVWCGRSAPNVEGFTNELLAATSVQPSTPEDWSH